MPAEAVSPVSAKMACLISCAIRVAEGLPTLLWVTSKYASSNERGSTKSV